MKKKITIRIYFYYIITFSSFWIQSLSSLCPGSTCNDAQIYHNLIQGCFARPDAFVNCCTFANRNGFDCDTCVAGYVVMANNCVPVCADANCMDCSGNSAICLQCNDGFFLESPNCTPCPRKCSACVSLTQFTKCRAQNFIA
jgi:hypothetical protein